MIPNPIKAVTDFTDRIVKRKEIDRKIEGKRLAIDYLRKQINRKQEEIRELKKERDKL